MRRRPLRTLVPALAVLAAAALSGCGENAPGGSSGASVTTAKDGRYGDCEVSGKKGGVKLKTVSSGTLTVAGDLPSRGWWNGETVDDIKSGFEYCLAANIAHRAGLDKLSIRNVSFDAMVAGKGNGFDLAMAEISITDERKKAVDFSSPYFASNIGVLARPGKVTADNIRELRLGVKQATSGAQFVRDTVKPEKEPQVFPGDAEMLAALKGGRIDAVLTDTAIVLGQAKGAKGELAVVGQYETGESYGALLPKDSSNTEVVNGVLAELESDGTLERLSEEYLGDALGGDPAAVPVWSL
ncbi:ABC transporter substrate-binding protein [Streptomyces jumonjinensis]|uniref:ABC transporter substrate-binding protein n=1 Tax=Streptomyces jumonjinensis TaxID=1945 RepID=UPI002B21F7AE|nr:ABC transporter substrate-binding protein [Streptomyces jumonjinensis]